MDILYQLAGAVEDRVGVLGEEEVTRTVVEVRQCPVDHVYDPFRLTCRRIRCRDGTQYKDGRSVYQETVAE